MKKFEIPKLPTLKYGDNESKMLSLRLPEKLIKRLKKDANLKNLSVTQLCTFVLDQYCQQTDSEQNQ
ncbi:MAG: hypothetical protein HQK52_23825 [Oligoflexia bacterium]|nr:hypothetical protein [Oligoflexia bacterium]